jgi:serine/threonine protein kinase
MGYPGDFMESEASKVARTLLGVLKTLHEKHCCHRDIKPENILLVNPDESGVSLDVKLTDFGLARILRPDVCDTTSSDAPESNESSDQELTEKKRTRAYSCVGSDFYTAPEVSIGLGYDTPVDIYSLGVTLYVMLCGTPPSMSQFNHSLYKIEDENKTSSIASEVSSSDSEESGPPTPTAKADLFPQELNISPLAQDFVCKLIHPDPDRRITASDALKHQWITKYTDDKASVCEAASESSPFSTTRSMSIAEAEALLKLPIQGSLFEIAPPVLPPSNSPKLSPLPTPPPVNVTLANVCSKLVPLLDEQRRHNKHRRHKNSPRKHSRGAENKVNLVGAISTSPKKGRVEKHLTDGNKDEDPVSCNRIRIVGEG